ncbi:GntR family transcriptional regulator [Parasphingorhabdus sp.]|jgi:GntR family transcriptional regulator|uniref:GntR family transcriptional regulator n=1 Tax=Parasphingorhabdus sp. TaxID=2709688 RepID=UPI001B643C36|nr:GntR family transcriptional regulator [Parasphingorhabdus sp.]MBQ0772825.1 GntR family transcriptional regulator [Sphingomonadales bacterium]|tara:strand:- start:451 stop:795 length:345 start_codon:yes stop_codon:yes gene_type:complete
MNKANKPVYLKLRDIISESILDGEYREGDMLPSVRVFAAEQGANPLTVAKAYQGFQEDGLVTVKRGVGMFVAAGAKNRLRVAQREDFIKNIWPPVQRQMERLDLSIDDLVKSDA